MSLCRTCLSENDLKPIFADKSLASTRSKQLHSVTGVKIELNDGLPQFICAPCSSLIKSALKLREQSSKSQEILNKTYRIIFKKETDDDDVNSEHITEYYVDNDEKANRQMNSELNSNISKKYTLIQIQNVPESSNMNLEHEVKGTDNSNSNSEQVRDKKKRHLLKRENNSNVEHGRRDKKMDNLKRREYLEQEIVRKRRNYELKRFGEMNYENFEYSVSIEDFESSNDDDVLDDIYIEDYESPDVEEPIGKVRIEDFESSDSMDLEDLKFDSTDLEDIREEYREVISQTEGGNKKEGEEGSRRKSEKELFERQKKKLLSKVQECKLMSLAVTPYNKRGPIKCRICDSIVRSVQNFKSHAKTHFELENACEECGKKFANRNHMRYHQQRVHGHTKRLACTQCTYRAVDPQTLRNHERAEHTGERPYVCNECGDSFRMRANLVQHMRKHFGVRNMQCERCPAMFRSRSELWGHQNRVHFMTYTYLCYLCPETYKGPLPVRRHLANIHGVAFDQQLQIKCINTRRRWVTITPVPIRDSRAW